MLSSAAEGTVYRGANLTLDNVERLEVFDYAHDRLRKAVVRLNVLNDLDLAYGLTPRAYGFMLEENLIQIAGVIDAAEAQMLQQCGVRYLGFPLRLPVHREDLTEEEAAAIIKSLAPPVFGVLITYLS